jgi:hypothetical protein
MKPQDLWPLFNLRDTPYFQEALRPGDGARYPVEWFIGREIEADRLARTILGHAGSSRQTIRGAIGVGKSTLVQHVKAILAPYRLYSNPDAVALGHADGSDEVCIRVLSYVYETLLAAGQDQERLAVLEKNEAVQNTRQLVRIFRETTGLSGGVSIPVLGGGLNAGRSTSLNTPGTARPSILIAQLLRGLFKAAREHLDARGIVVHVNNLENLTDADATRAGAIFRDLRDTALLLEGYHWLVVGTSSALRAVVDTHSQMRSVFSLTLALEALQPDELTCLLNRRYAALAADSGKPARPPITHRAVQALYALFQGDLRGTLAALDEAAHGLLGYGKWPDAPLTLADMHPFLRRRYDADIRARLTPVQAAELEKIVRKVGLEPFGVHDAASAWKKERSWVARLLAELNKSGYVMPIDQHATTEERGRPAASYTVSGAALLAFGGDESWDWHGMLKSPDEQSLMLS